ncbi:MAG: ATP-binding protein [Bacteroidales bacterium]
MFLEIMPNPVIVYDSDWRIYRINDSAIHLLGYSPSDDISGKSIQAILPDYENYLKDELQNFKDGVNEEPLMKEVPHLRKDGKIVQTYSQFRKLGHDEIPLEISVFESGFFFGQQLQQIQQQQKKLNYWKILAESIPGLLVMLVDKHLDIQISLGSEKTKGNGVHSEKQEKNLLNYLSPDFVNVLKPLLTIAISGTSVSREFSHGKDYFAIQLTPVYDKNGEILCLIVLQNITETKLVEKKLQIAKEEAEEANEAKSNFIAKMSHEIRTPLNAILGFTEQLNKTRLTKKQSSYLNIVNNSSQHLLSIIDEILVLSKIESRHLEIDEVPFKITNVIKAVQDVLGFKAKKKNLSFGVSCDQSLDVVLLGDPSKLRQILINLADNSIKFTPKGGLVIDCSAIQSTAENLAVHFEVSDSGIGISQEEIDNIFKPFHQVDNSVGRSYFGSGLGLTISKDLIEFMGGNISVTSTPGKGSKFMFTLTFKKSSEPYQEADEKQSSLPDVSLSRVKILFVDDDPFNRILGKVILKQYKVQCDIVNSGEEAIRRFAPGHYHLVFLDINMPGTSGIDVAKHIRKVEMKDKRKPVTKIIAMTANVLKKHIEKYLSSGMDDFILKPFREEDIYRKIIMHTAGKEHENLEISELEDHKQVAAGYDLTELLKITRDNKEFTLLMLDTFLDNTKNLLEKIKKAFKRSDYDTIAEVAHRLLPSVEQLGLRHTASVLRLIEGRYLNHKNSQKDPKLIEDAINNLELSITLIRNAKGEFSQ